MKNEKRSFKMNWHIAFAAGFLLIIALLVLRIWNYGTYINLSDIEHEEGTQYEVNDYILPLINDNKAVPADNGIATVVAFGNAPFADWRDSSDNLANLIAEMSGATVYNCSVSNTYLAAVEDTFRASSYPMDAFNFYWLTTLFCMDNEVIYELAFDAMGDDTPGDAIEVYNTLTSLDFSTVDVITLMYDASDYLAGHDMYNDANPTDITQFTGNMEAGIELIQATYPHIRIIVLSPTYAFALDEEGNMVSSDMYRYGQDVLATYFNKQYQSAYTRSVSFVDNLYGTIHEDNADVYLTGHLHLNLAGRKLVAQRFVYALNYYNNEDNSSE